MFIVPLTLHPEPLTLDLGPLAMEIRLWVMSLSSLTLDFILLTMHQEQWTIKDLTPQTLD